MSASSFKEDFEVSSQFFALRQKVQKKLIAVEADGHFVSFIIFEFELEGFILSILHYF